MARGGARTSLVTTAPAPARPVPGIRRRRIPASPGQALVWGLAVLVILGPLVPLVYTSFRSKPYYLPGGTWTLGAYRTLFADPEFWRAVQNTVVFAAVATVLAVALGAGFAILVSRTNMPGRRWLGWALLVPIVTPPLALIVGWSSIYGEGGYLTQLFGRKLGLPTWNLSSLGGMAVLGAVVALPVAFLTCRAALAGSDGSLERAALSAGASPVIALRRVTLPLLRPAILNSAILIFALLLETLGIPLFLGTPANINFYASYLYKGWVNGATPDPPYVSAGAVLLLAAVTILLLLRTKLLGSEQRFIVTSSRRSSDTPLDLGRWRFGGTAITGAFVLLASVIPLAGLALMSSVKELTILVPPWHLWTDANWHAVLTEVSLRRSIQNSLLIAAVGGVLTVVFVAVATLVAHRSRFALRRTMPSLLVYPRAIPGIILGVGFFWAFLIVNVPGAFLRNSIWGELLALCIRNLTVAYVVLYPSLVRMNPELELAATASGAGWWTTARRIVLPVLRPALLAALALMFITLLNDYDPVVFLQKTGTEILGVTMLHSWEKGLPGQVASLALIQVVIVGAVLAGAGRAFRRATVA
jgi:iron(III) transport system permease protein